MRGGRGHPNASRSAEVVSSAMPNAALATIAVAAHSMLAADAVELVRLIGASHVWTAVTLK